MRSIDLTWEEWASKEAKVATGGIWRFVTWPIRWLGNWLYGWD